MEFEEMKTKLKAFLLATAAAGALAGGVLAQTPPPARTATPRPVAAPLTPARAAFDLSQLPATQGTVKYFTLTPRGDVDGFVLADGTQVHVPPHLSTQLVAAVRLGDAVTVRGLRAAAVPMVAALSVTGDARRPRLPARRGPACLGRAGAGGRRGGRRRQRPRPGAHLAGAGHSRHPDRPEPQWEEVVSAAATPAEASAADEAQPSARSLRGLDGITFLMADVRDGVGPYLSVFLKGGEHWDADAIGVAVAASSIAAAVCQVPAGLLVDGTRAKRLLIVVSGLMVGVGCLLIAFFPRFATVIAAQVMLGAALAVIPPVFAALSLGLVGRQRLDARISRNESFNHGGNFVAAGLAGVLGQYVGYDWIFYLVCGFAVASALVVTLINPAEIDHERARGGEEAADDGQPIALRGLLRRRDLLVFLASVVLFHFGNAAMLPMAGQVLAVAHPGSDTIALSACIIAAQLVMVGVAWAVGRASGLGIGRKPIFLLVLAVLPIRGVLFSLVTSPYAVVAIQLLDGVATGIFGVVSVLIASDLMRGTGRFNLAQGLTALSVGIGAALSNLTAGFVVQWFGYATGFLYLAGIAAVALVFFAVLMPETRSSVTGAGSLRQAGTGAQGGAA